MAEDPDPTSAAGSRATASRASDRPATAEVPVTAANTATSPHPAAAPVAAATPAAPPVTPPEIPPAGAAARPAPPVTPPAAGPATPPLRPLGTPAGRPASSALPPATPRPKADWAAEVADRIDDVVAKVRANTSDRLVGIVRMVVYGLLAVIMALVAAVLLLILGGRVLAAIPGEVWISYLAVGAILVGVGLLLWSRGAAKPHNP